MNIKEFLIEEDQVQKLLKDPDRKEYLEKKNFDIRQIYLEFNTGGLLDDLPPEAQTVFKNCLKKILKHFEALLMSSLAKPSYKEIGRDLHLITEKISSIGKERESRGQENRSDIYI